MQQAPQKPGWLDRPVISSFSSIKIETLLFALIMILAVFSRLYILGARVMSHDEINHVVPSWDFSEGRTYMHDPVTHGPFQFHLVAMSYVLFGDNDFTSRLPAALFGIATVAFGYLGFKRYFGSAGGLIAAAMLLISPYVLFYDRYTRNEAFVALEALVLLWSILRYLETSKPRYLYLVTLAVVLHIVTKETAYIYIAQALLFLAGYFVYRLLNRRWSAPRYLRPFVIMLVATIITAFLAVGVQVNYREQVQAIKATATATVTAPSAEGSAAPTAPEPANVTPAALILFGLAFAGGAGSIYLAVKGLTFAGLREEPSFDLLMVLGTLILPHLSPFLISVLHWKIPINATEVQALTMTDMVRIAIVVIILFIISAFLGLWWNRRLWLGQLALFYAVFTVFYTSVFTNGAGFLTGLVGSLGYWLSQQEVNRGEQPLYYFALVQIPMYEYLPAVGTVIAFLIGVRKRLFIQSQPPALEAARILENHDNETLEEEKPAGVPVLALLVFQAATALFAYSLAGEKMPWLTVHIAVPMILTAAWGFGYLVDTTAWRRLWQSRGWLAILLLFIFLLSLGAAAGSLVGANPPFQGQELGQLQATTTFIFSAAAVVASAAGLLYVLKDWSAGQMFRLVGMTFLALLAVQTARTAVRSSFINYDLATEFLVYAHAARGPKDILAQVEEISKRTTGGLDIAVAYDNNCLYPYWWYFRDYPNKVYYGTTPTRELRNNPIILVSDEQYGKIESIVGSDFYMYQYVRLWWPMQDYFHLDWARISNAIRDPNIRAGLFDIWLNDDFTRYAQATGSTSLTLTNWYPDNDIRMYIRKDVVAQIWNYGTSPVEQVVSDPYAEGRLDLQADAIIGSAGSEPGQFQAPRGIALAPDGSLYVADSRNHRIQHLAADGSVIQVWGSFADANAGDALGGTFNEPWGVAVAHDGSVYVADTWNNRIQKFTADGEFVQMWGYFGQAETPDAFWGPRGLAVDSQDRIYVTDTGNKRVVVFNSDGQYVAQFGSAGFEAGQFSEPVGITIDASNWVFVADTWNQRMQVFAPDETGNNFIPAVQWDISGWFGESLENKPFISVSNDALVFVADPEGARILIFDQDGKYLNNWGNYSSGPDGFGLVGGLAADNQGGVWAADAGNHRIMHFTLPQ